MLMTSPDQDPVFNHSAGTKTVVSTDAVILVPPTGCKYVRVTTDGDVVVNTNGQSPVDDGSGVHIIAYIPEVIPVNVGVPVRAAALSGSVTVRCMPLRVRG